MITAAGAYAVAVASQEMAFSRRNGKSRVITGRDYDLSRHVSQSCLDAMHGAEVRLSGELNMVSQETGD